MRSRYLAASALAFAALISLPVSRAQEKPASPSGGPIRFKRIEPVFKRPPLTESARAAIRRQSTLGQTIPLWGYTATAAQGGGSYSGIMVGRSPFAHGHRVTTIPTYLVPVKLTFADSGTVFDPTGTDSCSPAGESVITLVQNSPLLVPTDFTMNGVDVGTGQYVDEFQRANFWSEVEGTPYHTTFSTTPTVVPTIALTVPIGNGQTFDVGGCKPAGVMDFNWWDTQVQTVIIPALAAQGVGPANLPQFIFDSVVEYEGTLTNCCILGYHSGYNNSSSGLLQTYLTTTFDNTGAFSESPTTAPMSHEIGEWMDDPTGNNPTPSWGNIGQVSGCQANLEVGDPLSGTTFAVTNTSTGVTYTLQELAFFNWFLGATPSLGAGGGYSNEGSFQNYAGPC